MIKDEAYKWLQNNANMYRGNNASDCMIEAFVAGAKLVESKFTSDNSVYAKCTIDLCGYICDLGGEIPNPNVVESVLKKHFAYSQDVR